MPAETEKNSWLSKHVLVLGAGNFGTCLAQHLADKGYSVTIWSYEPQVTEQINTHHKNSKYLSTLTLSHRITATNTIDRAVLENTFLVVIAVPCQFMRSVLSKMQGLWKPNTLFVCAAKGIEIGTDQLPTQIISETLGPQALENSAFLSGPSFASEVAQRQPTAVTMAAKNPKIAQRAQEIFHAAHFRVYTSDDPIGVEVGGALKNVIAIAAGACDGIGYQMNSRAALITRGLAEITNAAVALGANPLTLKGLSGMGDLILTCTSPKSRNYTVGFRLGKGEKLSSILETLGSVSEGVTTTKAAYDLCRRLNVATPIVDEVYNVLYNDKPITHAVTDLMTREAKPELNLPPGPHA